MPNFLLFFKLCPGNSARDHKDGGGGGFSQHHKLHPIFLFLRMILLQLLANIADQRHQIVNCRMALAA